MEKGKREGEKAAEDGGGNESARTIGIDDDEAKDYEDDEGADEMAMAGEEIGEDEHA